DGQSQSVVHLKKGDPMMLHEIKGGRHFGKKIEETITEK
ncbi:MAG: 3-dehydroquinate synthase II, partial [Spirochaetes bacterium]|nr:3-dehydroquinate synthase II [Spirochaetota bacterium]